MSGQTTTERGYGQEHQLRRARYNRIVLAGGARCAKCGELIRPGEPWDLGHVPGDKSRYLGPLHRRCNRDTSVERWKQGPPEPEPERDGLPADDERWDVPWLKRFRRVPADAVWPRLMTVPHPRAESSLGPEFIRYAERRSGRPLRWWQRLVATRLLEVDENGELVWETMVLSMARQLGKSWLLRELILWRIHQGKRFGEEQTVLHTGKDVAICKEIQRPVRAWAKARKAEYKVTEVNGQEQIEYLADGSRWMIRAKEAVYGYSVSVAAADEAWKVRSAQIEEGLTPTMVERAQPQLWLVSTAHRLATDLMLERRRVALAGLEDGDGDLLVEWSAPHDADLEDRVAWRQASPHWTSKRERLISKRLEAAKLGEVDTAAEEPDPEQSFRSQWLNQWPRTRTEAPGNTEDLLPVGLWAELEDNDLGFGPLIVALEDDYGRGAAVGACWRMDDGRIAVDGWTTGDWDSAILHVERLHVMRPIRELYVGASLLDRVPKDGQWAPRPVGSSEMRAGLAVFRDLAASGMLAHDDTGELDQAIAQTKVRESPSGLVIAQGPAHLIKAVVWAVAAAHRPARAPPFTNAFATFSQVLCLRHGSLVERLEHEHEADSGRRDHRGPGGGCCSGWVCIGRSRDERADHQRAGSADRARTADGGTAWGVRIDRKHGLRSGDQGDQDRRERRSLAGMGRRCECAYGGTGL